MSFFFPCVYYNAVVSESIGPLLVQNQQQPFFNHPNSSWKGQKVSLTLWVCLSLQQLPVWHSGRHIFFQMNGTLIIMKIKCLCRPLCKFFSLKKWMEQGLVMKGVVGWLAELSSLKIWILAMTAIFSSCPYTWNSHGIKKGKENSYLLPDTLNWKQKNWIWANFFCVVFLSEFLHT